MGMRGARLAVRAVTLRTPRRHAQRCFARPLVNAIVSRPGRRSPSSTWAPTASASRSAASKATRSSVSTRGARRSASAPASTRGQPDARRAQGGAGLPRALPRAAVGTCIRPPSAPSPPTRSASRATRRRSCRRPKRRSAFPIDIIGGHEEARLIYLGVAHVLPASRRAAPRHRHRRRLDRVHHRPRPRAASASNRSSSAASSMSQRFFASGELRADAFRAAETDARARHRVDRARVRARALARGVRIVGHRARARRDPRGERPVVRAASRPTASRACASA